MIGVNTGNFWITRALFNLPVTVTGPAYLADVDRYRHPYVFALDNPIYFNDPLGLADSPSVVPAPLRKVHVNCLNLTLAVPLGLHRPKLALL
jgi:hypothetical protein